MKSLIISACILMTLSSFASVPADTHLGCQLYTGESSVFSDLRKFNISTEDVAGVRVLDAYLAGSAGLVGSCANSETNAALECIYYSSDDKRIVVILDNLESNEIEGRVYYDGWFDKSHPVSCDLLTF